MNDFKVGDTAYYIESGYDGDFDEVYEISIEGFKEKQHGIYATYYNPYRQIIRETPTNSLFHTAKEAIDYTEKNWKDFVNENIERLRKEFA